MARRGRPRRVALGQAVKDELAGYRLLSDGELRATVVAGTFEHARRNGPGATAAWLETMARNITPAADPAGPEGKDEGE